jgi:integrase/recombinase XerD
MEVLFVLRFTDYQLKVEDFMLYCTSKNLSKKTLLSYQQVLSMFGTYLQEQFQIEEADRVTKNHIRQYVKYLSERGKYTIQGEGKYSRPSASVEGH